MKSKLNSVILSSIILTVLTILPAFSQVNVLKSGNVDIGSFEDEQSFSLWQSTYGLNYAHVTWGRVIGNSGEGVDPSGAQVPLVLPDAYSGSGYVYCAATPNMNVSIVGFPPHYEANQSSALVSPSVSLRSARTATLQFSYNIPSIESGSWLGRNDYMSIRIHRNGGGGDEIAWFDSPTSGWKQVQYDLSSYIGSDIQVEFLFKSDGSSQHEGVYVDEVQILADGDFPTMAPRNVVASPFGWSTSNSFQISWNNPDDPTGIVAAYYKIGSPATSMSDPGIKPCDGVEYTYVVTPIEGKNVVYVWLKNGVGAVDVNAYSSVPVFLDHTSPAGILTIGDGSGKTNSMTVSVNIQPLDGGGSGVQSVQFSNDGYSWSDWEDFSVTRSNWNLSLYGGNESPGLKKICARLRDGAGNESGIISSEVWFLPSSVILKKISGDSQTGIPGSTLKRPLVVRVEDALGNPTAGAKVVFSVTPSVISVLSSTSVTTDANGEASTYLTLSNSLMLHIVTAKIENLPEKTVNFHVSSTNDHTAEWINTSGGLWSDPNNWSTSQVPSDLDTVYILAAGEYTVQLDVDSRIARFTILNSAGTHTLEVNNALTISTGSRVAGRLLISGTLDGPGDLIVNNGYLGITQGQLKGSGVITIEAGSELHWGQEGSNSQSGILVDKTVACEGRQYFENSMTIIGAANCKIYNLGGATTELLGNNHFSLGQGLAVQPVFSNSDAMILKGNVEFGPGFLLSNTGSVEVQSGSLVVNDGQALSGTIQIAEGQTVEVKGNFVCSGNLQIIGPGGFLVNGGRTTISGNISIDSLSISGDGVVRIPPGHTLTVSHMNLLGGSLTNNAQLELTHSGHWLGSVIEGAGVLSIRSAASFDIEGANDRQLLSTIANSGQIHWKNAGNIRGNSSGRIVNNPTGVVEITNDALFAGNDVTDNPAFENNGLLKKGAGVDGSFTTIADLRNNGTIDVSFGDLVVKKMTHSGGGTIGQRGLLIVTDGPSSFNQGSSLSGQGTLSLEGGVCDIESAEFNLSNLIVKGANLTIKGLLRSSFQNISFMNGIVTVNDTLVIGGTMKWSGGTLQ
ncbi:MAG: Ig-like domain-containing protein, partial [Bacteroidota bacterium]